MYHYNLHFARYLKVFKDSLYIRDLHTKELYPIGLVGLLNSPNRSEICLSDFKEVRYYSSGDILVVYNNGSLDFIVDTLQVGITIDSSYITVEFKEKKVYDKFIKDLKV